MSFLIANFARSYKMKQKLKVELVNKFDASVLDNHFYSYLLERIKVVKQNQVKSSNVK